MSKGTIRRLDYMGFENDDSTKTPLMVVEAKSLSVQLPDIGRSIGEEFFETSASRVMDFSQKTLETLKEIFYGEESDSDWTDFFITATDYARSIYEATGTIPSKYVLTNGSWIIIFKDPKKVFIDSDFDFSTIALFENFDAVIDRYEDVFQLLDYYSLVNDIVLKVGKINFFLSSDKIERICFGMEILLSKLTTLNHSFPQISVRALIMVRLYSGFWYRIQNGDEFILRDNKIKTLEAHIKEVDKSAKALLSLVNSRLNASFAPTSIIEHFNSRNIFDENKAVQHIYQDCVSGRRFFVVTGSKTHFLRITPIIKDCKYHDWGECPKSGSLAQCEPIARPSYIDPFSFFPSGHSHHCAHSDVYDAKVTKVTDAIREKIGCRSSRNSEAFCEINQIDELLCCRVCVFEDVCCHNDVFVLPCSL